MAILHRATLTPTKAELLASWSPTQSWGPPAGAELGIVGAFRFDDPDGKVGMETHLVAVGDTVWQIPLTYREAPLAGADDALAGEMEHSALGTRWVYDGLRDPQFLTMLAAVSLSGQGQAVGMVVDDGRWCVAPSAVRLSGGGWAGGRVPVDGFALAEADGDIAVASNDRFRLEVFRRPVARARPPIGLTASWDGLADPVVPTSVTALAAE